jgi:hypothetical protein
MTTKTENKTDETISNDKIDQLRKTIRSSWVTSVEAIYVFGKNNSRASIKASLEDIGLTLTKKANAFTGAAKLALSEFSDGKWDVCDGQVSRYARVCKYLNSLKVPVDGVEKALEGKTMTELVQNKNKKSEVTQQDFEQAVVNIEQFYAASKMFTFEGETLPVSGDAGLVKGANMAIVVCDMAGNITAIRGLASANDKLFREKVVADCGSAEVTDEQSADDLIAEIVAEAA